MKKLFATALAGFMISAFLIFSAFAQSHQTIGSLHQASPQRPNSTLTNILNPDGSIKTSVTHGSFNAQGYRMVIGKNRTPRFTSTSPDPNDKNWDPSFTVAGVGGYGFSTASSGDTLLYVGGIFGTAGNAVANNIATYNLTSNTWSALDTTSTDKGVNSGSGNGVTSILVVGNDVYIGGYFQSAGGVSVNNIVDYNTSTKTWTPLGSGSNNGVNNVVWAMAYFGGSLYVGGQFTSAGGGAANYIARWDGSSWHALGSGVDNTVYALAISNGSLYVGGQFQHVNGNPANNIAMWDGSNWYIVGTTATDLNGSYVYSITPAGNSIYVGGDFTTAGGTTVNGITKWDGSNWNKVGTGITGTVSSIIFSGTKLYVCGQFTAAGLITVNNIAVVDTSTNTWSALGTGATVGTNNFIYFEPSVVNGRVYLPGRFTMAGGISAFGIASWNGTNWTSLGGSTNVPGGNVNALAISGENIYVGGSFLTAGTGEANNIAVFNRNTLSWSSLGIGSANGVDHEVYAIAVSGGDVYVGGSFTHAGGLPANHIAMWDGAKWNTLGTAPNDGTDDYVNTLATFGTDLYVGGAFTHAGGNAANYIAKWDGTSWSALGAGVDGEVHAIASGTNEIYVGGSFSNAGGSPASNIAEWNGTTWSALGSPTDGVDGEVLALAAYGDTVFVGGSFSNAGGNSASHLAKWNTSGWSALGTGVNNDVYAIAMNGTNLLIGGQFTSSGLVNANGVIEWDITNNSFITLGDGLNSRANAIVSTGNDTYFGGPFSTAGDKPSYSFARYNPSITGIVKENPNVIYSFELSQNYPNPFNPSTKINYSLPKEGNVKLVVFNSLGQKVAELVNGFQEAGEHNVEFNAINLASGIYFYSLQTNNYAQTKKMILLK